MQVPRFHPESLSYPCVLVPDSPTRVSLCNARGSHPMSDPSASVLVSSEDWWGWLQVTNCPPQTFFHTAYGTTWKTAKGLRRTNTCDESEKTRINIGWIFGALHWSYPGCPGRCCLRFGSRFTVSFSFWTASLLGQGAAISSSDGGPRSNITTSWMIDLIFNFINIISAFLQWWYRWAKLKINFKKRQTKKIQPEREKKQQKHAYTMFPVWKRSGDLLFCFFFRGFLLFGWRFLLLKLLHIPLKIPKPGVFFVS